VVNEPRRHRRTERARATLVAEQTQRLCWFRVIWRSGETTWLCARFLLALKAKCARPTTMAEAGNEDPRRNCRGRHGSVKKKAPREWSPPSYGHIVFGRLRFFCFFCRGSPSMACNFYILFSMIILGCTFVLHLWVSFQNRSFRWDIPCIMRLPKTNILCSTVKDMNYNSWYFQENLLFENFIKPKYGKRNSL